MARRSNARALRDAPSPSLADDACPRIRRQPAPSSAAPMIEPRQRLRKKAAQAAFDGVTSTTLSDRRHVPGGTCRAENPDGTSAKGSAFHRATDSLGKPIAIVSPAGTATPHAPDAGESRLSRPRLASDARPSSASLAAPLIPFHNALGRLSTFYHCGTEPGGQFAKVLSFCPPKEARAYKSALVSLFHRA
eukprot:1921729-Pyramimonas_sp.AAC.1